MIVGKTSNRIFSYVLLIPPLLFLLSMVVYPLLYGVNMSLRNYKTGEFNKFHNFVRVVEDPLFFNSLKATGIYVVGVIATEFLLGLSLALIIYRFVKSGFIKVIFYLLLLMPLVTPPVAAGIIFRLMYTPSYGIINYLLQSFGLIQDEILWLSDPGKAMFSVMSVDVWQWTPFVYFIFSAGLQAVPPDAVDAAKVDGASGWQVFRHIELSYLKPLMLMVLIFRLADTFQIFDHVMVLTQGGPGSVTQFLSVYLYKIAFKFMNLNYAAAISFYVILFAIMIFYMLNKALRFEDAGGER